MRQKVAICCAYLHDPLAILFDEPHTGLDPRGIRTMKESVIRRAAAGAAVVVSSHLLALVEDLCTHLLILNRGRTLFFGPRRGRPRRLRRADRRLIAGGRLLPRDRGCRLVRRRRHGAGPPALPPDASNTPSFR